MLLHLLNQVRFEWHMEEQYRMQQSMDVRLVCMLHLVFFQHIL